MSLLKSKKSVSTKRQPKKKVEVHDLKAAYIIPAGDGDKMIEALGELPGKYWEVIVGPMVTALKNAFRGDITIRVDPNKPAEFPGNVAGKALGEIPPVVKPKETEEPKPEPEEG